MKLSVAGRRLALLMLGLCPVLLGQGTSDEARMRGLSTEVLRLRGLLYGANAYGRCVSKMASTLNADKTNAAKQCAAERADAAFPGTHGGKTFAEFYGADKQGKQGSNAFGKCVSSKAKALDQQQQQATITAAKTCKAERTKLGPTEFTKNYGGHSNAFGKCVSKTAHANP